MSTKQETKYNKSAIVFITWILLANILLLVLNIVAISIQRSSSTDRFHDFVLQGERPIWTEEILEKTYLKSRSLEKLIADQNFYYLKICTLNKMKEQEFSTNTTKYFRTIEWIRTKIEKFHPEKQ